MTKSNKLPKKFSKTVDFNVPKEWIEDQKRLEDIFNKHLSLMPESLRLNIKSTGIYIKSLETLLKNKEFCKSSVWVEYIKDQIDVLSIVLDEDEIAYNPFEADNLISKDRADRVRQPERKKGGNTTNKSYRETEKRIIKKAKELIKKPLNNRPSDRYRKSSLAEDIHAENKKLSASSPEWILLPAISSTKRYLRQAVKRGELPEFLLLGNPKKY